MRIIVAFLPCIADFRIELLTCIFVARFGRAPVSARSPFFLFSFPLLFFFSLFAATWSVTCSVIPPNDNRYQKALPIVSVIFIFLLPLSQDSAHVFADEHAFCTQYYLIEAIFDAIKLKSAIYRHWYTNVWKRLCKLSLV